MQQRLKEFEMPPTLSLTLILGLGLGLRLYGLTRYGYWIDEASAVLVASHSPGDIVRSLTVDTHPPLYYLLLHAWMQVGDSTFFVRLFSAVCGVLTIWLAYRLTSDLLGHRLALVTALLLAISPAHIWYSQEARMYALLVLLCTLSFYLAWRWAWKKRTSAWVGYVLASTAALYTQYIAAFFLIGENVAFLSLFLLRGRYRDLVLWLGAQACVVLAFLPWLPTWYSQVGLDTPWIHKPDWAAIRQTWVYLGFGADWTGDGWSYLRFLLLLASLGIALVYVARRMGHPTVDATDPLFFPVTCFLVPALLLIGVSLFRPVYQDKQLLIVLLAMLMIVGWVASRGKRLSAFLGLSLLVVLTLQPLYHTYFVKQKQQWREASQYISSNWEPHDIIYYNAGVASVGTAHYLDDSFAQAGYPILFDIYKGGRYGSPATAEVVDEQLSELASHYHRLWLVQFYPAYHDPEGFIIAWLNAHACSQAIPSFYGVDLQLYVFCES